ncbi:cysteine and histidine-rich protein 1-like [Drosophila novamexicana]|uniref:cysteine and histidine-rich protein 1-like n=1 Tax=Drosophila novamexicana TaxID=47314 RepID=UPI0011E5F696|nr:cysteine and histidine-rich protein 1-like [Drosophila novamexicana]
MSFENVPTPEDAEEPEENDRVFPETDPAETPLRHIPGINIDSDDELANVPAWSGLNVSGNADELEALRCIVCKTMPFTTLYQCQHEHPICAGCYQMRVLDKMLGAQLGTCPQCGVRIYRHEPYRNLAGEHTLAQLMVACEDCGVHLQRSLLRKHGLEDCPRRLVPCKYRRIGCNWKGMLGEAVATHEESCEYHGKQGLQLLDELQQRQEQRDAKQCLLGKIMKLLQLPHITVRLLQLLPQLEGFPRNNFKTCAMFEAFSQRWSVQLKWQTPTDVEEPADQANCPCSLLFQLCLESPDGCRGPLGLTYTLVSGTHSDVRFQPNLCEKCDFTRENVLGPLTPLYHNSWQSCAKLLNERGFFGRLLMARI